MRPHLGRRSAGALLVGVGLLATACGSNVASQSEKNPVVKIGVMLSLTGPDASIGKSTKFSIIGIAATHSAAAAKWLDGSGLF